MTVKTHMCSKWQENSVSLYHRSSCLAFPGVLLCIPLSVGRGSYPACFASPPFSVPLRSDLLRCVLLPLHCDWEQWREGGTDRQTDWLRLSVVSLGEFGRNGGKGKRKPILALQYIVLYLGFTHNLKISKHSP